MNEGEPTLFRQEARDYYAETHRRPGDVLRLSPTWARWTYWLLLLVLGGGLLYVVFGRFIEYAEGPAVIWRERTFVTAHAPGTVESVEVDTNSHVAAGQVLVRLHDAQEQAELERVRQAFELQVVNYLRNPLDEAARQALTTLRTQRGLAEARLEQRCVCAPHAGVVGDIRIREGQYFAAGDILLSLRKEKEKQERGGEQESGSHGPSIIAMLPAHYGPLLKETMELRLQLTGHRYVRAEANIEWIEHEALGLNAIRRYLGQQLADSVAVQGPVVIVHGRLKEGKFELGEGSYDYYHGMQGTAQTSVRSDRVICALVPALKPVFEESDFAAGVMVAAVLAAVMVLFTASTIAGVARRLGRRFRRRQVPFVPAMGLADYGEALLAMVLGYHGKEVFPGELREVIGGSGGGLSASDIKNAALRYGLRCRGIKIENVDDLRRMPPASILHRAPGDFIVFERVRKSAIDIVHPRYGRRRIPMDEFSKRFGDTALIFEPSEGFEPGAAEDYA